MDSKLHLISYNCRGLPKLARDLDLRQDLVCVMDSNDIICIQETWYSKQDLPKLNNLHSQFHGVGVSSTDLRAGILYGHPPGGVAILWRHISWIIALLGFNASATARVISRRRKDDQISFLVEEYQLDKHIKPLNLDLDGCVAIEVELGAKKFIIFNIYLPYQCRVKEDKYLEDLGVLCALIEDLDSTNFVLLGDWNANLKNSDNSLFAKHMLCFCDDLNLISSRRMLPEDSYTYVSASWGSESWSDHVVSTEAFDKAISDINICYNISDEDHIPVALTLAVEEMPSLTNVNNSYSPRLNWETLSDADCNRYTCITNNLLQELSTHNYVYCKDVNCSIKHHAESVNCMYEDIIKCLKEAGRYLILMVI